MNPRTDAAAPGGNRLVSLDAYRGFTMLAMASAGLGLSHLRPEAVAETRWSWLQSLPQHAEWVGRWGWLADQFQHRVWLGCTFWDLIQPSFMFIVGVAMIFSFANRQSQGQSWWGLTGHALWRAFLLCLIGFILDGRIQFIRVLQQIAIGYLIVFPFVPLGPWVQAIVAIFLLGGHTAAYQIHGNALGIDPWQYPADQYQNFGMWIDAWLRDHLFIKPPEGNYVQFNAISSAATIMFGVLAGELLRSGASHAKKLLVLTLVGCGALVLGWALSGGGAWVPFSFQPVVPMIKRLWTSSFAIFAGGWTCLMLALFYLIIDVWQFRTWSFPFIVVGMNSIAMYVAFTLTGGPIRSMIDRNIVPFFLPAPAAASYANTPNLQTVAMVNPNWAMILPVLVSCGMLLILWLFCYALYRQKYFFKL
jgi:predicted acyltransferase